MNVLEINYTDLPGHIFNGYDLHLRLNQLGFDARMIVRSKKSLQNTVYEISIDEILHQQLIYFEKKYSVSNVVFPYAFQLQKMEEFQKADLVHYHILHNQTLSLLDYPNLMNWKYSVWTVHDPWIITGNCIHPLECQKWRTGCGNCSNIQEHTYKMNQDNTRFMWNLKKDVLKQINPDIVVSCNFMKKYLQESPLTNHFNKIHIIPFGVDTSKYDPLKKNKRKQEYGIDTNKMVIGFRSSRDIIKGCNFLYKALEMFSSNENITLLCVGEYSVPEYIAKKYQTIKLGWLNQEDQMIAFMEACDIFVMPSLAESFGMMAVEALAAGCSFICFQTTVMEEISQSPDCGIAVQYQSSEAIAKAIYQLMIHPETRKKRGMQGRELIKQTYTIDQYVEKHKNLYENILVRDR